MDTCSEPFGYDKFLCYVNVEFCHGGRGLSNLVSNKQCLKLKVLPYLITFDDKTKLHDEGQQQPIDVTRETCAFLGVSEYVPKEYLARKRVVLELISAKLSAYNIPIANGATTPLPPPSPGPLMMGKRYVNYTLLIKTIPKLDTNPTVIERRFSDFQTLYQGIKSIETLAQLIGEFHFPRKVLVGNFSFPNIADRSKEFARLLKLCMDHEELLNSAPFVSFLLDKELKEAHFIITSADPDDVLSQIEIAYRIQMKIYMPAIHRIQSSSLFKRIVVTFAMLIFTHYRSANLLDIRTVAQSFINVLISPGLVQLLANDRYKSIIRSILNFLIEIDQDESILKSEHRDLLNTYVKKDNQTSENTTKIDLMTFLQDRNLCCFQDRGISLQES